MNEPVASRRRGGPILALAILAAMPIIYIASAFGILVLVEEGFVFPEVLEPVAELYMLPFSWLIGVIPGLGELLTLVLEFLTGTTARP